MHKLSFMLPEDVMSWLQEASQTILQERKLRSGPIKQLLMSHRELGAKSGI